MRISPAGHTASQQGPADWFTGAVRIDALNQADSPGTVQVNHVTFEPGARTENVKQLMAEVRVAEAVGEPLGVEAVGNQDPEIAEGLPGLSAYVRVGDEEWAGASGLRSVEEGLPITPDTAFYLASVTKPFTHALVTDLMHAGLLERGASLAEVLPQELLEGLPHPERITVEHLLEHRSGIVNFTDLEAYSELRWRSERRDTLIAPTELVDLVRGLPARFEPGERFEYCNTGFLLLGLVAERAGGAPLHELLRERILDPLGMRETYMTGYEEPRGPLALAYSSPFERALEIGVIPEGAPRLRGESRPVVCLSAEAPAAYNAWAWAAGGLNGTPRDVARFVSAAIRGDVVPWNEEIAARMRSPGSSFEWNGGSWGIATSIYGDTRHDVVVALFSNGVLEDHDRYRAFHALIDMALARARIVESRPTR